MSISRKLSEVLADVKVGIDTVLNFDLSTYQTIEYSPVNTAINPVTTTFNFNNYKVPTISISNNGSQDVGFNINGSVVTLTVKQTPLDALMTTIVTDIQNLIESRCSLRIIRVRYVYTRIYLELDSTYSHPSITTLSLVVLDELKNFYLALSRLLNNVSIDVKLDPAWVLLAVPPIPPATTI